MQKAVALGTFMALCAILPHPSEQFGLSGLGQLHRHRASSRPSSSALSTCMADDMLKRVGRLAKDKVSKGKQWIDDGSNLNKGFNLRC
mmetsp:Transcript_46766/g.73202  ORF Transcript_46766/g.73202 Transcript_46766/m.73202 type:complete len:88 (+) Transcript_46766:119-382(+)